MIYDLSLHAINNKGNDENKDNKCDESVIEFTGKDVALLCDL